MAKGTFGERLKHERELREVSPNEIVVATRISLRFLEALENEPQRNDHQREIIKRGPQKEHQPHDPSKREPRREPQQQDLQKREPKREPQQHIPVKREPQQESHGQDEQANILSKVKLNRSEGDEKW